ncbi:hypothetical protein [Vibrio sp. 1CM24A]|uniref:hypothetical protein n=1 Tax=Vibrio sp. 1CM24A TaxID=2929165 RepID=UPI0020C0C1B1|nr:hypothetical protein [Vibrio sp. 1CM24A]MCK8080870.1 hypothetical protein [Vibrio sp. 1CM24A]
MNIAALKSHQTLPLARSINPFFINRGTFFEPNPGFENLNLPDQMLFDSDFALIASIRIRLMPGYRITALRIQYSDDEYEEVQYSKKTKDGDGEVFIWTPSKIIRKIEFVDTEVIKNITGVSIMGRTVQNLQILFDQIQGSYEQIQTEWENKVKEIQESSQENQALETKRDQIKANVFTLEDKLLELDSIIKSKEDERDKLDERELASRFNLKQLEEDVEKQTQVLFDFNDENEKLAKFNKKVKSENKALTVDLNKLKVEKYRYSEDFDSFKRELSLQNSLFLALISLLGIVGAAIVHSLLSGSYDLIDSFNRGANIYELLISRIPSVTVNSLIILFISKWLGVLIQGLINNLDELKKLKKLVYLVTEVTESQAIGLAEDNEPGERYKQRVMQKMSIIRDALNIKNSSYVEEPTKGKVEELSEAAGNTLRVMAGR